MQKKRNKCQDKLESIFYIAAKNIKQFEKKKKTIEIQTHWRLILYKDHLVANQVYKTNKIERIIKQEEFNCKLKFKINVQF